MQYKTILWITIFLFFLLLLKIPHQTADPAEKTTQISSKWASAEPDEHKMRSIKYLVKKYSKNTNISTILKIIQCESNFDPNATNPNSTATGLFQITKATFNESKPARDNNWTHEKDAKDPEKNIIVALYYINKGQLSRWNASKHCWE